MRALTSFIAVATAMVAGSARAEIIGAPKPWQLDLPVSASDMAQRIYDYHLILLYLAAAITAFVLGLLVYVSIRFRARANPTPSKVTHNTFLEVVWSAIPAVILLAMVIPTLRLLYMQEVPPPAEVVIKATGHQWYWSYEYPDEEFSFDALMLSRDEVAAAGLSDSLWKLATDQAVVVPVNRNVLVQVTASDVIHAWTVPNLGSKVDAVPGRITQTWFRATTEGTFYGQCSELCGRNHAYMPITVRAVSDREYQEWLVQAREEFANAPAPERLELAAREP